MDILSAKEAGDYESIIKQSFSLQPKECTSVAQAHAIGKAYEKKSAFSQAIPWYLRSFELEPHDETFGMIAGVCLAIGNYSRLQELLELESVDKEGYFYRAAKYELAFRQGKSAEQQIETLENFMEIQYEKSYMLRLAMLYLQTKADKSAIRLCKRINRLFADTEEAVYAKELLDAIQQGDGLAFIQGKPWLKDEVFKHVSFDTSIPPLKDIVIESSPKRAVVLSESVSKVPPKKEIQPEKKPEKPKNKIPPLVEKSMKDIVGMDTLKKSLSDIVGLLQFEKKRKNSEINIPKNLMILGADGSGKTTAAYAACRALKNMGLIDEEEPVIAEYETLLSDDDEELHDNIQNLFESAEGKCVLIENIHEFDDGNAYSIGLKIIDMLTKAYTATEGAVLLMITGRKQETEDLLRKKRKFGELFGLLPVYLENYSLEELLQITEILAEKQGFVIEPETKEPLKKKIESLVSQPDFAYSRDLEVIVRSAILNLSNRLRDKRRVQDKQLYIITAEDVEHSESSETVEELLAKLDAMTGLNAVKKEVHSIVNQVKVRKMRTEAGLSDTGHGTLHLVFTGNAGTGKTTVARILGKIYKRLGVLPKGQLVECTRKDLISNIYGATDKQVSAKVKEAMGGILFIDEAYSLCRDDNDTYGKEAIETLLTEIENHRDCFMVILAGYSSEMNQFLDKNQGLRSRIPTIIEFEDYSEEEMLQIFKDMIESRQMKLDVKTDDAIRAMIAEKSRQKDFGNGRGIRNLVDEVMSRQSDRLAKLDPALLSRNDFIIIRKEDLNISENSSATATHKTCQDYLNDLNALTGLASAKQEVQKIVAMVQANVEMKKLGLPVQGFGTLHMVFKGNAGTGKTTVARIIGNIYRELGVLSQGQLIECDRSSLVAGYVGQTAVKTKAKIQEALGGILFIDEAYALMQGGENDFGREAITTLVADIENYRDDLCVILAGYSEDMDKFLESNQGLVSRFPNTIYFDDYSIEEMLSILYGMVSGKGMKLAEGLEEMLREMIQMKSSSSDFGNARGIRNLVDKLNECKNMRVMQSGLASMTEQERIQALTTITADDVRSLMKCS